MVKSSKIGACKDKTIDQFTSAFLSAPKWESGASADGTKFVNVLGGMMYGGKSVDAKVQFEVDSIKDTFKLRAVEFNGVPQADLISIALLKKMCAEAGGRSDD